MVEIPKIKLTQLAGNAPAADALRMSRGKNGPILIVSHTVTSPVLGANTTFSARAALDPDGIWSTIATVSQMLPAQPKWDVAPATDGQLQIASEKPGGAINALMMLRRSGSTTALTTEYPLQSFSGPKFAKPSGKPPQWLTAIVDNRTCVAIQLEQPAPYRTLGECSDGLLVQHGSGFIFIYKTNVSGTIRGNLISPGRIYLVMLNTELQSMGPPVEIFNGTIFEFDADFVNDKLIIVATTQRGLVLVSRLDQSKSPKFRIEEFSVSVALTSPAIVASTSGKVLLAALESDGQGATRILMTELAIPLGTE